ncbi:hypothetical protein DV736_g4541, partial [Chaetothyriales sp. CBS 134916]
MKPENGKTDVQHVDHNDDKWMRRKGQVEAAHLFRGDKEGHVIERLLIPRPTNDPKDPLTWARRRKHLAFTSISFFVLLFNYSLSAASPGLVAACLDHVELHFLRIWAAVAKSYGRLLGARIVAGFGASALEAVGLAVVADLYFLHERGEKTAFYTLMIGGGSALGGIFGGLVVTRIMTGTGYPGCSRSCSGFAFY